MKVFKISYTKKMNGATVTKKTTKFYGRLRKATGITVRVPLLSDKYSSQALLSNLQKIEDQIKSGILPPQGIIEKKSLLTYVDLFQIHLKNKTSESWANEQKAKLKLVFGNGNFVYPSDVNKNAIVDVLEKLIEMKEWSNQTYTHYVKALSSFFNWLVEEDFIPKKPYKKIELKDTSEKNLVHQRRVITIEEFNFLIESVKNDKSKRLSKISKNDRINLYRIIFYLGLRAEELFHLKPICFDFSSCTVTFDAGKTRKCQDRKDTLPLHPDLVFKIKDWVLGKEKNKPLWDCWDSQYFGALFKKDMGRARDFYISSSPTEEEKKIREQDNFLKWEDKNGLFADLHSLRTTFITNVSKVASPKQCQKLARHSDINTTFKYYVKTIDSELANVIGKLSPLN